MANLTTRAGKGAALTHQEVDDNFTGLNTELGQKEVAANKGVANGYASLDASGRVPSGQLPSYVDDVLEFANLAAFPATGETGKIYVALDTNKVHRWSGSAYVEISASPGSTDSVAEGTTNLYFTQARARASVSASGSLAYNSGTGVFSYTQPTNVSTFTNDAGYITSSASITGNAETATRLQTGRTIAVTGDVTGTSVAFDGSANLSFATTLANSGVTAGTYGSSSAVPVVTVDAKGRVTGVSTSAISGSLTFTGDVTGSGTTGGSTTLTLANSGVTAGSYGSASAIPVITVDAKGRLTGVSTSAVSIPSGSLTFTGDVTGTGTTGSSTALTLANSGVTAGTYTKVTVDAKGRVTTGASLASGDLPTYTGTLTSSQVTTALGFTPYNSTNPAGYITSASLSSYLPLSGGTLTGVTLVKRNLGTNDYTNVGQHNLHLRLQRSSDVKTLELGVLDNGTGVIQANEAGVGYQTLALNPVSGAVTANGNQVLHAGNYSGYFKTVNGNSIIGSGDVTITLSDNTKLPLAGGTLTGDLRFNNGGAGRIAFTDNYHGMILRGHPSDASGTINSTDVTSLVQHSGDFRFYRTNGSINEVYFQVNATAPYWRGNTILHAENYNSYSPSLTGSGASGTWGISINGEVTKTVSSGTSSNLASATVGSDDFVRIRAGSDGYNSGWLELATADDGNEPIYVRQYTGVFSSVARTLTLLDSSGNTSIPGTGSASSDFRAPIFYDSNDTAYYTDPASTSVFSKLTLNGKQSSLNVGAPTTSGTSTPAIERIYAGYGVYGEVLDFGFNVGTSYGWIQPTNYTNLAVNYSLLLNPNGGNVGIGVSNATPAAKVHVVNGTPTGIGGLPSGVTGVFDSSGNNYLLFRNTGDNGTYSGIAFQDNNVGGYVIFGNAGGGGDLLYVAGYGGGQLQYGSADSIDRNARTTVASWNSTGLQINNGDMRAPIYYDSNNTAYYADFASSGTAVQTNGTGNFGNGSNDTGVGIYHGAGSGDYGRIRFYQGGTNNQTIHVFSTAWQGGSLAGTSTGAININGANGVTFGAWNDVSHYLSNAGTGYAKADFRSPIFYDSNDTGYYVDPNTTGTSVNVAGTVRGKYFVASNYTATGYTQYKGYDNNNHFIVVRGSVGGNTTTPTITGEHQTTFVEYAEGNDGTGWFFKTSATGGYDIVSRITRSYSYFEGSARSPIFYDSNDTGYYCDPNGTSRIGGLSISPANTGSTGNGIFFYGLGGDGAGAYNHAAIVERLWGGSDESELLIFKGNDPDTSSIHDRVRIAATGRIVFHSTTQYQSYGDYVGGYSGNIAGSGYIYNNDLVMTGNVTAYSDERLKKDWSPIRHGFVDRLAGVLSGTYTRIDIGARQAGVSAQAIREILPEVVSEDDDGTLALAYGNAAMVAAVELAKELVAIRSELKSLKERLQ